MVSPESTYRWLPPEEQQLLSGGHLGVVNRHLLLTLRGSLVDYAGLQQDQGN